MRFNEKLKLLREEKRISQEELAVEVGVSRQAISKWENGSSQADIENLIFLSKFFGVTLDYLIIDKKEYDNHKKEKIVYNNEEIIHFLVEAKKNTYASSKGKIDSIRIDSHDLKYEKENMIYIDTYLGSSQFGGQEAIWKDGVAIWYMNYSGRVLEETFSSDFLKEALKKVNGIIPFRGPRFYQNGDYIYHFIYNGSFEWFDGVEEVLYRGEKVYEGRIHGGLIK